MHSYKIESIRKIARFLRQQPEVQKVRAEKGRFLHINFDDGFVEHWSHTDIEEKSKFYGRFYKLPDKILYPFGDSWPEFRCQFNRITGDELYDHKGKFFLYSHNYLFGFPFCNVRVFLHRLARQLVDEGYVQPWLTPEDIKVVVGLLNGLRWSKIRVDNNVYKEERHFISVARPLITTQVDVSNAWNISNLFTVLDRLYKMKIRINRSNIVWRMRRSKKVKFSIGYPIGTAALMRDFHPDIPIVDHIGLPWLKVVATINDVEYKQDGDGVHITDHLCGHDREMVFGSGDYKIIGANPNNQDFMYLSNIIRS